MQISFHGACQEVTGSCNLVETSDFKFLVDCGSFQGEEFSSDKNAEAFLFDPAGIDFVFLTHAHLDHCGRLPKLMKEGFGGKIYCTAPTKDIVTIILFDAAKIMGEKQGINPELLFSAEEIEILMSHFVTVDYDKDFKVNEFISIKLKDAGHILGSAFFEIKALENGVEKKLLFSGDLGNPPAPIIRDTEFSDGCDVVVMESTYGGLIHEDREIGIKAIRDAIFDTIKKKSVLIIPVFAVERSQEIIYELNNLVENNMIPKIPMFFDSPMGINALEVYKKYENLYDEETRALINSGDDIFAFRGMKFTPTTYDSKQINMTKAPKIILAGSGMCNGGRVIHHLKFNLSDFKAHVMLLSYQAKDTLGRKLMDGEKSVVINEENIKVRAKISVFGCFSSHADEAMLENWFSHLQNPKPVNIFINHGEIEKSEMLVDNLKKITKNNITIPELGVKYEI